MSPWVDFREIKQSVGIEQVLAVYRLQLKRVRLVAMPVEKE